MCRIQNSSLVTDSVGEFPLADLTAVFQPSKDIDLRDEGWSRMMDATKRIPVDSLTEQEYERLTTDKGQVRKDLFFLNTRLLTVPPSPLSQESFSIMDRLEGEKEEGKEESTLKEDPDAPKTEAKETSESDLGTVV